MIMNKKTSAVLTAIKNWHTKTDTTNADKVYYLLIEWINKYQTEIHAYKYWKFTRQILTLCKKYYPNWNYKRIEKEVQYQEQLMEN